MERADEGVEVTSERDARCRFKGTTRFMKTIRVRATGNGRIVGWSELKNDQLVDRSRFSTMTTVLTDVVTDLCELSHLLDSNYRIETIIPNGPTSASLDLKIVGRGFDIVCARRLVRGWFPFNPVAAEFGSNYDVVVTVSAESADVESRLIQLLTSKYVCILSNQPTQQEHSSPNNATQFAFFSFVGVGFILIGVLALSEIIDEKITHSSPTSALREPSPVSPARFPRLVRGWC